MKTKKVKALSNEELNAIIGGAFVYSSDESGSTTTDVTSELASGGTTRDTEGDERLAVQPVEKIMNY